MVSDTHIRKLFSIPRSTPSVVATELLRFPICVGPFDSGETRGTIFNHIQVMHV